MHICYNPLVTVIIPVYNRVSLIDQTLNSVFNQSYKNIEILVIDDGSTDDLIQALQPYIDGNLIRYVKQQKRGVSFTRNNGLRLAKGEFVAFLDSDDLYYENKLEEQVNFLVDHQDIQFVHSNFEKFASSTKETLGVRDTSFFKGNIYPDMLFYWKSLICMSTVMFRTQIINEIGFFNENLSHGEDLEYWARIAKRYKLGHVPKVLAGVRVHSGNVSTVRLSTSDDFQLYIEKVFENDNSLHSKFKHRVLSNMFLNTGLMLLTSPLKGAEKKARTDFSRAVKFNPRNYLAYLGYVIALLPFQIRCGLYRIIKGKTGNCTAVEKLDTKRR